ncbi:hypothetical protein MGLY_19870 [Neomoorella glycerini]|uniref:Integrase n=1 Tax=Neomoorella glycerini TaxID=55779 RepID=A0A6I5ZT90_9FIRM|nr:hypothetical protein [Moorella glycerini]QGP92601.1 hypothetical protein MGLY_19870 [Moorella glycerini]
MLQDVYDEFELELQSTAKSAQTIETYRSDFLLAGLRRSEIIRLNWEDVDFNTFLE